MKPCRGCGCGTVHLGIHGVVASFILQFFVDIRWQRHFANLRQNIFENAVENEFHNAASVLADALHTGFEFFRKHKNRTRLCDATRFQNHFPMGQIQAFEQQKFNFTARTFLVTVDSCRQHFGVVNNQNVTLFEIIGYLKKLFVFDCFIAAIVHQQPCTVSRFHGGLRNKFFGQIVVEITGLHLVRPLHKWKAFPCVLWKVFCPNACRPRAYKPFRAACEQ